MRSGSSRKPLRDWEFLNRRQPRLPVGGGYPVEPRLEKIGISLEVLLGCVCRLDAAIKFPYGFVFGRYSLFLSERVFPMSFGNSLRKLVIKRLV